MAVPANIILGEGVFSIGSTAIALTRGGGSFSVEREYRQIEADGDYGPVKGRIRLVKSVAKLQFNALEILPANIPKFYPALEEDTTTVAGTSTIRGIDGTDTPARTDIADADYNDTVKWVGKTKAGKAVTITLENAINLENIEWALTDKDEIVPEITYTATYLEASRTKEPWKIDYVTA